MPGQITYGNWSGWQDANGNTYTTSPMTDPRAAEGFYYAGEFFPEIMEFKQYAEINNLYNSLPFFDEVGNHVDERNSGHDEDVTPPENGEDPGGGEGGGEGGGDNEWGDNPFGDILRLIQDKVDFIQNDIPNWKAKKLNIQDYTQQIPDELKQYASEGYGKDWMHSAFHSQADALAGQEIQNRKQIDEMSARSGFQNSGFAQQAKELSRANETASAIGVQASVDQQNQDLMQNAKNQVSNITDYNKQMGLQVDQWNRGIENQWQGLKQYYHQQQDLANAYKKASDSAFGTELLGSLAQFAPYMLMGL